MADTALEASISRICVMSDGSVSVAELARELGITRSDLAADLGVSRDALSKSARRSSAATQRRLGDLVEILARTAPWAGSIRQAHAWYRAQPLPSFGDQTAADLVREGRAAAVKGHLSRIAVGGYA